jgi:hypothetical protein
MASYSVPARWLLTLPCAQAPAHFIVKHLGRSKPGGKANAYKAHQDVRVHQATLALSTGASRLPIRQAASIAARVAAKPIATYPIASIISITTLLRHKWRLTMLARVAYAYKPRCRNQLRGSL